MSVFVRSSGSTSPAQAAARQTSRVLDVRGLRMRMVDILQLLSASASFEEILPDYPFLERQDILDAIEYAAMQTDHIVLQSK
jgi:uncharacterized protein (DUF433 family)